MSKIIIGIHGLGNKPPRLLLKRWWEQSIHEGLEKYHGYRRAFPFEMVFWANIIHKKSLKPWIRDKNHPLYLGEPYHKLRKIVKIEPNVIKSKIYKFAEKFLDIVFLNKDMTLKFQNISKKVIHDHFSDLDAYHATESTVREKIRNVLYETLEHHKDDQIMLIAHSMGSIIALDVLNDPPPEVTVETFITIGSPLGLPMIASKIFEEQKSKNNQYELLTVPEVISGKWINLSDNEDKVAMDHTLEDDYNPNSSGVSATDITVINDFEIEGERNPHKAYGYLRTREMAKIIRDFLTEPDPLQAASTKYQELKIRLLKWLPGFKSRP